MVEAVWIPVVIVLVALGVYAAVMILGGDKRRDLAKEAETEAKDVKAAAEAALTVELAAIEGDRRDLEAIKAIGNDAERLQALADYANRRRKR